MEAAWIAVGLAAATLGMTLAASAQGATAGQQVFRKCMPCHCICTGAKNLVGSELNGFDGRHTGSVAGHSYSAANKNFGITWNQQSFEKYIKDPRGIIPGTKMSFAGIKNEKDIHNLWADLKQFGPDGKKCRKPAGRWRHLASVDLGQCPPSQWHAQKSG